MPCHGQSGKRSRRSNITSAAVLEAVKGISKAPAAGTSTEIDIVQRVLCAVKQNALGFRMLQVFLQSFACHGIWLLLAMPRFPVEVNCTAVECKCCAYMCLHHVRLEKRGSAPICKMTKAKSPRQSVPRHVRVNRANHFTKTSKSNLASLCISLIQTRPVPGPLELTPPISRAKWPGQVSPGERLSMQGFSAQGLRQKGFRGTIKHDFNSFQLPQSSIMASTEAQSFAAT